MVAPVSGTVVEIYDAPDERDRNANHGWGGMTLLRGDNGYFYRLSHARPGSIAARPGQRVAQGQRLQEVGLSGNTTGAHLDAEKFARPGQFEDIAGGGWRAQRRYRGRSAGGADRRPAARLGAGADGSNVDAVRDHRRHQPHPAPLGDRPQRRRHTPPAPGARLTAGRVRGVAAAARAGGPSGGCAGRATSTRAATERAGRGGPQVRPHPAVPGGHPGRPGADGEHPQAVRDRPAGAVPHPRGGGESAGAATTPSARERASDEYTAADDAVRQMQSAIAAQDTRIAAERNRRRDEKKAEDAKEPKPKNGDTRTGRDEYTLPNGQTVRGVFTETYENGVWKYVPGSAKREEGFAGQAQGVADKGTAGTVLTDGQGAYWMVDPYTGTTKALNGPAAAVKTVNDPDGSASGCRTRTARRRRSSSTACPGRTPPPTAG